MNNKTKQPFPALRIAVQAIQAIPQDVHEIDYLSSFIAKGLAEVPKLREHLPKSNLTGA